eukprot:CAMPEP_0204122682 /NCGR_PEP_ID=MMETSP0361-20130328/8862_1 /ASSEMBLY_ACC=CAM_ASM_000343 /TAXON_ID=268821 /ORGANISM="Scrippsiella Hangoei, Strain SHTV-5" /LENGTH=516 /DNA_ID=CAMNT_0051074039 /DNA_START=137 /DNA_END=1685 /DNA_ORIENTATION=+
MPHLRSTSSQVARMARAIERGYLLPKPCGSSFVLVETPVAARVADIARSLEVHRKHELLVGTHFHHASRATVAASTLVHPAQLRADAAAHRCGNSARHRRWLPLEVSYHAAAALPGSSSASRWADACSDSEFTPCDLADDADVPCVSSAEAVTRMEVTEDCLLLNDPWSKVDAPPPRALAPVTTSSEDPWARWFSFSSSAAAGGALCSAPVSRAAVGGVMRCSSSLPGGGVLCGARSGCDAACQVENLELQYDLNVCSAANPLGCSESTVGGELLKLIGLQSSLLAGLVLRMEAVASSAPLAVAAEAAEPVKPTNRISAAQVSELLSASTAFVMDQTSTLITTANDGYVECFAKIRDRLAHLDAEVSLLKTSLPSASSSMSSSSPGTALSPPLVGGAVASCPPNHVEESIDDLPFLVGQPVSLVGLKSVKFNGQSGLVTDALNSSGRIGILLWSQLLPMAVSPINVVNDLPAMMTDECAECRCTVNLNNRNLAAARLMPPAPHSSAISATSSSIKH